MICQKSKFIFLIVFCLYPLTLTAQSLPEWQRVYTFDESIIELNTSLVTLISKDVTRVRFRWTFNQPQLLSGFRIEQYQTQLEVMEFNCSRSRYRPYHTTLYDSAGNIVRISDSPGEWRTIDSGSMIEKLFVPGCNLIRAKTEVKPPPDKDAQLNKVALFAQHFAQLLDKTQDFKSVVDRFFIDNYLEGYLRDRQTNWFLNLDRDTAATLNRQELQRFYLALMNAGYLSSVYLISQVPSDSEDPASLEKLLPRDVLRLIRNHRYTTQYKFRAVNYDFLSDNINSVGRLRSYTDLIEKLAWLMRSHTKRVRATRSKEWHAMLNEWDLYQPKVRTCAENCFGLPNGTKLYEVNVPVFNLQVAEVGGTLKVVTAISRF